MRQFFLHWFILLFGFTNVFSTLYAQPAIAPDVLVKTDQLYQTFAEKSHSPGLVYGIVYNGALIHIGSFGYANLDKQVPVSGKTVFRIASMTKSFISAAVVKLRDEGKLQLDDPVGRYIPAFKRQALLTKDSPTLTIRHLLTHAAGFPEDNPWGDRQLDISDQEMDSLINNGFSFSNAPGIKYEYSNTAFALLGHIIKQITGLSYNQYVDQEVLKPLGMSHTYWEYDQVSQEQLAIGYRWLNGKWIKQPMLHNGAYGAMGGMLTSMEDFGRYVQLHLNAWPARDEDDLGPVKRASLREMQHPWNFNALDLNQGQGCPVSTAYAYGLRWSFDCHGIQTVGHTGGLPGFGSNWLILPDYGLGLICFSNVTYAAAASVNTEAISLLLKEANLQPREIPVSAILEQRKKELLTYLPAWKQEGRMDVFADNFFLDNYDNLLKEESKTLFQRMGAIQTISKITPENNLRGTFSISGDKGEIQVYFTLSPEANPKIQQLQLKWKEKSDRE